MDDFHPARRLAQLLLPYRPVRIAVEQAHRPNVQPLIAANDAAALAAILRSASPIFGVIDAARLCDAANEYVANGTLGVLTMLGIDELRFPWPQPADRSAFDLDEVIKRGLVRMVLGTVELCPALQDLQFEIGTMRDRIKDLADPLLLPVDPEVDFALALYRAAADDPPPWALRLDQRNLIDTMLLAHKSSFSFQDLVDQQFLAISGDYVRLADANGHATRWKAVGAEVAAAMWLSMDRTDSRFTEWLRRIGWLWKWVDAPLFFPPGQAHDLLDAAVAALCSEPMLRSWEAEEERLLQDCGSTLGKDAPPLAIERWLLPHRSESFYSQYVWLNAWHDAAERHTRIFGRGSRHIAEQVVNMVVHYDDGVMGSVTPWYRRVGALLKQAQLSPKLIQFTADAARKYRLDAVAMWLGETATASLALTILSEVQLHGRASFDSWFRSGEYDDILRLRRFFWTEALTVLGEHLERGLAIEDRQTTALALSEIVLPAFERLRLRRNQPQVRFADVIGDESQLLALLDWVASVVLNRGRKNGQWLPLISWCAGELTVIARSFAPRRVTGFAGMPDSAIRLLLWLNNEIAMYARSPGANIEPDAAESIARAVSAEWQRNLSMDRFTEDHQKILMPLKWLSSAEVVPKGEWGMLAEVLYAVGELQNLLQPVDFVKSIQSIGERPEPTGFRSSEDALETDGGWHSLVSSWRIKLRLHIRMLCAIVTDTSEMSRAPVHAGEIVDEVAKVLAALLLVNTRDDIPSGHLNLFEETTESHTSAGSAMTVATLLGNTATVMGRQNARALIEAIVTGTPDIGILSAVAAEIRDESLRKPLAARIASMSIDDFVGNTFWYPSLERTLAALANIGEDDAVAKLRAVVEPAIEGHAHGDRWRSLVFRVQLLSFAKAGNPAAIEALSVPELSSHGRGTNAVTEERAGLARLKEIYRALALETAHPHQSVAILEGLAQGKLDFQLAYRLLSARLTAVGITTSTPETRTLALAALAAFDDSNIELPKSGAAQCAIARERLRALALAGQFDQVEATAAALPASMRAAPEIVLVLAEMHASAGNTDRAVELLHRALKQHENGTASRIGLEEMLSSLANTSTSPPPQSANNRAVLSSYQIDHAAIRDTLHRLQRLNPDDIAKVLHWQNAAEMFVEEIVSAANQFLLRYSSFFPRRADEDRYNDFLHSVLSNRLKYLGMTVEGQARGGFPQSGPSVHSGSPRGGVGERDLCISGAKNTTITIIECTKLSTMEVVANHADKLIDNYNPTRCRDVFLVVYAESDDFAATWTEYLAFVGQPSHFKCSSLSGGPRDCSSEYSGGALAVRVAQTTHTVSGNCKVVVWHVVVCMPAIC